MNAARGHHLYLSSVASVLGCMLGFLGILAEHSQLARYKHM